MFRFSLQSLLMMAVALGVVLALIVQIRENQDLKRHAKSLEDENGFIDVLDPNKIYVRKLVSRGANTWRFRVYLPDDADLSFALGRAKADRNGQIDPESLKPEDYVIKEQAVQIRGQFELIVRADPSGSVLHIEALSSFDGNANQAQMMFASVQIATPNNIGLSMFPGQLVNIAPQFVPFPIPEKNMLNHGEVQEFEVGDPIFFYVQGKSIFEPSSSRTIRRAAVAALITQGKSSAVSQISDARYSR